jgi:hypothetical protein
MLICQGAFGRYRGQQNKTQTMETKNYIPVTAQIERAKFKSITQKAILEMKEEFILRDVFAKVHNLLKQHLIEITPSSFESLKIFMRNNLQQLVAKGKVLQSRRWEHCETGRRSTYRVVRK